MSPLNPRCVRLGEEVIKIKADIDITEAAQRNPVYAGIYNG
jgi:hypothetical protein